MADNIFTGVTDNNWGTASNWSLLAVPTINDGNVARFNITSPNCVVNASSRVCNNIDFTGYINTFSGSQQLTVAGNVTLGSGMTNSYTGNLIISAASTINSNGIDFYALTTTSNVTYTLASNIKVTNAWNCNTSTATSMNGAFNVEVTGNWNCNNTSGTFTFTNTTISLTGNSTWTGHASNPCVLIGSNITVNSTTTTVSNMVSLGANNTLLYTAGTMTMTGSTLIIRGINNNFNLAGWSFNNVTFGVTTAAATLSSAWDINGTLTINVATTINSNTLNLGGNLTMSATCSGTTTIVMDGTTIWSGTSALSNPLTINAPGGSVTLSGSVAYNSSTFQHIDGVFDSTGSTITVAGNPTFAVKGSTSEAFSNVSSTGINFNNFVFNGGGGITLNSPISIVGNLSLLSNFTPNGSSINLLGGLSIPSGTVMQGTSILNIIGDSLLSTGATGALRNTTNVNTNGILSFGTIFNYETNTFTILKAGSIKGANNCTFGINLVASLTTTTLINFNKIVFKAVSIKGGATIVCNKFFSGSPKTKTIISSTTSTNYIITFQDGFEKMSKFVKLSNCTVTNKQQLLILTPGANANTGSNNNIGVRYVNHAPNGIPRNSPTVTHEMCFGIGSGFLTDPLAVLN